MPSFIHSPDGRIIIATKFNKYQDTVANFELDVAAQSLTPYPGLGQDVKCRVYEPDGRHFCVTIDDRQITDIPPGVPWGPGDEYIAAVTDLIAAQQIRAADPDPTTQEIEEIERENRNALLRRTDYTQLPDAPLTAQQVQAFATYRQALRDVPQQAGFPNTIEWPAEPALNN